LEAEAVAWKPKRPPYNIIASKDDFEEFNTVPFSGVVRIE